MGSSGFFLKGSGEGGKGWARIIGRKKKKKG